MRLMCRCSKLSARLLRSKLCTGTNKNKNHLHAFQSRSWLFDVLSYKPSKHILPRHSCIGPGPTGLTWALHGTYETRKHKEHLKTLKKLACLICSACIWMIAFHLWKFMPNLGKHVPPKKVTPFSEAVLLLVGPFLGKNSFFRLPYRRTHSQASSGMFAKQSINIYIIFFHPQAFLCQLKAVAGVYHIHIQYTSNIKYPPRNQHVPPWVKQNHLQTCLGMGYVSFQEGNSYSPSIIHRYNMRHPLEPSRRVLPPFQYPWRFATKPLRWLKIGDSTYLT